MYLRPRKMEIYHIFGISIPQVLEYSSILPLHFVHKCTLTENKEKISLQQRRRIYAEEKANVVSAVWCEGIYLILCRAS